MGHAGEEEQGEGRQTQVLLWLGRAVGRKPDSKTTLAPPPRRNQQLEHTRYILSVNPSGSTHF